MAEPQLSIRSAKARELAHKLAQRENRSVADIVERALEAYDVRDDPAREPAAAFYARLAKGVDTDIDFDALLEEHRKPHMGIDL